jgi:hypothetical protein
MINSNSSKLPEKWLKIILKLKKLKKRSKNNQERILERRRISTFNFQMSITIKVSPSTTRLRRLSRKKKMMEKMRNKEKLSRMSIIRDTIQISLVERMPMIWI